MFDENSAVVKLKCLPSQKQWFNRNLQFKNMQGAVLLALFLYKSEWLLKVIPNDIESADSAILRPQDRKKKNKREGGHH